MELNRLPADYDETKPCLQKRRTEFESEEEKLQYDTKNLIAIAKKEYEKTGITKDPSTFAHRKDDDIEDLRAMIAEEQKATTQSIESVELDPRLAQFKTDFDSDPTLQAKISWAEINNRLLANEGHYLALALAMEGGGILFGVDKIGNLLIADRGDESIMRGMNYKNTRDRVLYKHTGLDRSGKIMLGEDKKPIPTGYEMFPYADEKSESDEILQYKAHTGKPFIKSSDSKKSNSSWLESGKNPERPRGIVFSPNLNKTSIFVGYPRSKSTKRGVRRLLRVEKS